MDTVADVQSVIHPEKDDHGNWKYTRKSGSAVRKLNLITAPQHFKISKQLYDGQQQVVIQTKQKSSEVRNSCFTITTHSFVFSGLVTTFSVILARPFGFIT